jgi:PAS domain S-box-containing protein
MDTPSDIFEKMKHQKGENAFQLAKEISDKNIANETNDEKDDRFILQFYLYPLPTYIWKIVDDDMILVDINQAAMKFSGPKIKDLLGHTASNIYFDEPQVIEWMNQCRKDMHVIRKQFYLSLRTTGERKFLDASWAFFPPKFILFHVSDITEQKNQQTKLEQSVEKGRQDLEQSNQHLKTLNHILEKEIQSHKQTEDLFNKEQQRLNYLLENLPAIVFLINQDQQITYANQFFKKYIGDNLSLYCYEIMHCSIEQCKSCIVQKVFQTEKLQTKEWYSQSGKCFIMHYYPFHNLSNEPIVLGLGIDITERKQMEEQLQKARQIAEQSSLFKSQFLARMSHEIRTPMNGVLGMTDLLLCTDVSPEQKEYLLTLKNSGETLLTIINDILDISKIEAGKLEIHKRPFDLELLIEDVYQLLLPKAKEKQILFTYKIPKKMHRIYNSDPIRIRQILFNLIGNAIKFTDHGTVKVLVEQKDTNSDNAGILIEIKDSGPGIPKDQQAYIFQNYSQVDAHQQNYQGTGLGLSICYHLARMLDGKIWLKSQVNQGASFFLYLEMPESKSIIQEKTKQIDPHIGSTSKGLSTLNILLVEDNSVNRKVFKFYIEKLGYSFHFAVNGLDAIDQVKKARYHIIFMDIMMPKMDGIKATRHIREMRSENEQPFIIALTADAFIGQREHYLQKGFDDYITKPFKQETLKQVLNKYVSKVKTIEPSIESQQKPDMDKTQVQDSSYDWDQVQELKNEMKDNFYELVKLSLNESPSIFKSLQLAVDNLDNIKIKEYAHALKSISRIFGSSPLSKQCNQIEHAANAQSESNVQTVFQILEQNYHAFITFLGKLLNNQ